MGLLDSIPHLAKAEAHRPWPRITVDEAAWKAVAGDCAAGRLTLLSLWAEPGAIHMALLDASSDIGVVTHEFRHTRFPSVGTIHPPAIRFERAIRDLYGFEPVGL